MRGMRRLSRHREIMSSRRDRERARRVTNAIDIALVAMIVFLFASGLLRCNPEVLAR
jgi:hypothetical protein